MIGFTGEEKKDPPKNPYTPPQIVYSQYQSIGFHKWTLPEMRLAVAGHEDGNFQRSAKLAIALSGDAWIAAMMEQRNAGILSLPFSFQPSDPESPIAQAAAKEAQIWWDNAYPESTQKALLTWQAYLGAGFAQIKWGSDGKVWYPKEIEVWDPEYIFYDWTENCYKVNTQEHGLVKITPGDGKWIVFNPASKGWLEGLVRQLFVHFFLRTQTLRDWGRWSEAYGFPIKKAYVPEGAQDKDKQTFIQQLAQLPRDAVVLLPIKSEGDVQLSYELKFEQIDGQSVDGFDKLLDRVNKEITIRILGQNLTSEVSGGSFAAAKVHDIIRMVIIRAVVSMMQRDLYTQLVLPWARYNGFESFAPKPTWDTLPPADTSVEMDIVTKFVNAAKAAGSNVQVDFIELAKTHDIPLMKEPMQGTPVPKEAGEQ